MRKQMKRWISLLLCLVMTMQMLSLSAGAQRTVQSEDEPQPVKVTPENLTAYCVDLATGEESKGEPFDLAQKESWGKRVCKVVPAVWTESGRVDLTAGTTEFLWCYGLGKGDFCPIGMMPGKWGEVIRQHREEHPDDYENILLYNAAEGWTTNPVVPGPYTVGELLGIDAPCYLPYYTLVLYIRHTTDGGEVILAPYSVLHQEIGVTNSQGMDGWKIPTQFPHAVSARPLDWGYGSNEPVAPLPEQVPGGVSKYLTVYADINKWDTSVVYFPNTISDADGVVAPGGYCGSGLNDGSCGCYSYLWVVPAKGDTFVDTNYITPMDFVPVGMDAMQWQDLCNVYAKEDPKAWASGDYTGLYGRKELTWNWNNRLPMYSEANISGTNQDHSLVLEDYQTRTYACLVRWEHHSYTVDEEGSEIQNDITLFGFADPVTIIPVDADGSGGSTDPEEPENPDDPGDSGDPLHTLPTPLPEGYTKGLEWFGGVELKCDAAYQGATLSYQWYRSLAPEEDGVPFDDDYAHGQSNLCWAKFPSVDEIGLTYYYYCEYTFTDSKGVTQTCRTTTCALRRAPCSMLEVEVSPGAFYLGKDPDNTDYYSPAYMRAGNETLPLSDPDDYTLTYAYQVQGGESVLSAWIETDLYSSYGFLSSDYITWQWYKSDTEDWTQGEPVGAVGYAEGLTEISLSKPMVSGSQSLINYNAFNKHANIHVNCPTDSLEPFYMTVVITNHYTNAQGVEVTSESTARCKVFTFAENEDLYSVDENGVLNGYNGHESVWNIPASVDGRAVTSISEMAQNVRPPAGSDVRHYAGPTRIVIPEGVTEICDNAFYRLYSVEEVELPNTLRRIGRYAFGDTGAIRRMVLPASVEELGSCAFADARIQEFVFADDVWPAIGGSAFQKSRIKQVIFPANATGTLAGYTFYNCTALASVQNWTNIQQLNRESDFKFTPAYEYMVEGSGGDSDGTFIYQPDDAGTGWAVVQCVLEDTGTVEIPASFKGKPVTTVGRGVSPTAAATGVTEQLVKDVLTLRHVILPETVHTIRQRAFAGCENLETVSFHSGIRLVEREAFKNCYRLTSTVTLAAGAYIQTEAFVHCRSITALNAPGAHIAHYAFAYCFNLEQITDYVPWLPEWNNETSGAYLRGYVYWPFAYTKTYTDARESVRYYHAPDGEPNVEMAKQNTGRRYGNTYYNVWENDPTRGTIELYMGTDEVNVSIPGTVPAADGNYNVTLAEVGSRVFQYMNTEAYDVVFGEGISRFLSAQSTALKTTRMRNVTLPQSATDLGTFFQSEYGDRGLLESINIPKAVTRLESDAFRGNKKLHTVTFEADSRLWNIGSRAFYGCTALQEVDFSNLTSLTTIEESAFAGCDLGTVDLRACTSLTNLERYAFSGMYNIQAIRLPDSLEEIGIFAFHDAAYRYGSTPEFLEVIDTLNPLQELVLPANLKKIGKGAFRGQFMDNAANEPFILELPETLEEIGSEAFGGYDTNVKADMELWSNVALKDGKLPEGLKVFGCYSTAVNDDDNGEGMYSPFAYSPIAVLTFPAGLEILGINACKEMPKLTTVIFETKEQQVPGSEEPVLTGSLRELHPGSLDCGYVPDGWASITDIQGFENLRLLEYAESVFGQTTCSWKLTDYTVPGTVKRLGKNALSENFASSLSNISIAAGVEQIDNYAISNRKQLVGDYVTALEQAPRDIVLAEKWLGSMGFDSEASATLRCYTGSAFHLWAEKYSYPYELLDDQARVLFLDLTLNGVPVAHPEQWLDSCRWTDSQGNVVGDNYIFRDAREGETYTVTVTLAQEKLRDYTLPSFTGTVTLEEGQRYANVQLPLSVRDSITVQGVLPQHGEPGFMARVVQTNYPHGVITQVQPDANTGAFAVKIPVVDCQLVLTVNEDSAYVETVYRNFAMMGVRSEQTMDVGTLPMDHIGPMAEIPISNSVSLRDCGSLKVTDEAGNEYPAQLCTQEVQGVVVDCLSIRGAIQAGVAIGEQLTLTSHMSTYVTETVVPYTFTVPRYSNEFFLEPTVATVSRMLYQAMGDCYVYDQTGSCVASCSRWGDQVSLAPGSYTAIQIGTTLFQGNSLAEFLALDLDESLYLRTDFTISQQYYETVVLDKSLPEFDLGTTFGVQLTVDSALADADGRVPVYLQLNLTDAVPEGPVRFEFQTNQDVLPFVELDGAFVSADQPGTINDVQTQTGGGFQRASLSFTTTARTGVITLYAKADGTNLTLSMDHEGSPVKVAMVRLPEKYFSLNAPADITQAGQGVLTLFAGGDAGGYQAAVLVNGKEQTRSTLRSTGSGSNALPYTLKTYEDGSSLHTLQVLVYDRAGTLEWASQVYTLTHTNWAVPQPQKLDIRIINMNATFDDGSTGNVDGVSTVERASLDFRTGVYQPMKFVVPYWYYNEDGTMSREITFDYALSITNPEMITGGEIILKVFCKENSPYIREVKLHYNQMTGTFDGTLVIPGGTITVDDLPYGFSLVYGVEDMVVEPHSPQFLLDRVNEQMEERQELLELEELQTFNLDHLYHWLEEDGASADERDQILALAAQHNEIAHTLSQIGQSMNGVAELIYDMDSGKSVIVQLQQYLEQIGASAAVMPLDEPMTPAELLEMGFKEYPFNLATVYIKADTDSAQVVWLDSENPENSLRLSCGTAQLVSLFDADGDSDSSLGTILRLTMGLISTLCGAMDVALSDSIKLMTHLSEQIDLAKNTVAESKKTGAWQRYQKYGKLVLAPLEDSIEVLNVKELEKYLVNAQKQLKTVQAAAGSGNLYKLTTTVPGLKGIANGLTKLLGRGARIVPGLGTVIGACGAVWDLITLAMSVDKTDKELKGYWESYKRWDKLVNDLPDGVCHNEEKKAVCDQTMEDYRESIDSLETTAYVYYYSKYSILAVDVGGIIASLVAGVGNVASLVLGLGSIGAGFTADAIFQSTWSDQVRAMWAAGANLQCSGIVKLCDEEEEAEAPETDDSTNEDPDYDTPPKPVIDPSGYVYEAVASNRIQGAAAQVFYRDGEGNETLWEEAPLYDEINPQTTDVLGAYGWMTPPGKWLVKITKDGYLPADSRNDPAAVDGWLPVPPPQLNVNIGLISTAAPEILSAAAAPDRVQLVFSQYMDIAYLTANPGLITVTQNGEGVPVSFRFSDSEESPTGEGVFYGSILNITPTDGSSFSGSNVRVTVDQQLRNYASTAMESPYDSGAMEVRPIPGSIVHSYPNRMVVNVGDELLISAQVLDTQGSPMAGAPVELSTLCGDIFSITETTAVSDANGIITFPAAALRSGSEYVIFSAENGVKTRMELRVAPIGSEAPAKPTANLSDYAVVPEGTQLVISTTELNATIYYTTNNTCPCTDSPERQTYTGPITLTEDTLFRIAVYTQAGGYSERLNLRILVAEPEHIHSMTPVPAVPATCDTAGKESYYTCTCGAVFEDENGTREIADLDAYGILPALGHDWDEGVITTQPGCTTEGVKTFTCRHDEHHTRTEPVEALDHDLLHHDARAATCTEIGWDAYETCSRCEYTTYAEQPALGHTEVIDAAVAPTCTAAGLTEGKHCSVCGIVTAKQETVDPLGHSYDPVVTPPTCTDEGYTTHTCSTCGDSYVDDRTAAAGHHYTAGLCTDCGEDTVLAVWEGDVLTLTGEFEQGTRIFVVGYNGRGQFCGVRILTWQGSALTKELPAWERTELFFLDVGWKPLRRNLSVK